MVFAVVEESAEDCGGEGVVAEDLATFNWDWLRLVWVEIPCGLGKRWFGAPPVLRGADELC